MMVKAAGAGLILLAGMAAAGAPQRVFQLDQGRGTISATPTPNPAGRFEVRTRPTRPA